MHKYIEREGWEIERAFDLLIDFKELVSALIKASKSRICRLETREEL